jgi:hypothetical protein
MVVALHIMTQELNEDLTFLLEILKNAIACHLCLKFKYT